MKRVLSNTKRFLATFLSLAMVVLSLPASASVVMAGEPEEYTAYLPEDVKAEWLALNSTNEDWHNDVVGEITGGFDQETGVKFVTVPVTVTLTNMEKIWSSNQDGDRNKAPRWGVTGMFLKEQLIYDETVSGKYEITAEYPMDKGLGRSGKDEKDSYTQTDITQATNDAGFDIWSQTAEDPSADGMGSLVVYQYWDNEDFTDSKIEKTFTLLYEDKENRENKYEINYVFSFEGNTPWLFSAVKGESDFADVVEIEDKRDSSKQTSKSYSRQKGNQIGVGLGETLSFSVKSEDEAYNKALKAGIVNVSYSVITGKNEEEAVPSEPVSIAPEEGVYTIGENGDIDGDVEIYVDYGRAPMTITNSLTGYDIDGLDADGNKIESGEQFMRKGNSADTYDFKLIPHNGYALPTSFEGLDGIAEVSDGKVTIHNATVTNNDITLTDEKIGFATVTATGVFDDDDDVLVTVDDGDDKNMPPLFRDYSFRLIPGEGYAVSEVLYSVGEESIEIEPDASGLYTISGEYMTDDVDLLVSVVEAGTKDVTLKIEGDSDSILGLTAYTGPAGVKNVSESSALTPVPNSSIVINSSNGTVSIKGLSNDGGAVLYVRPKADFTSGYTVKSVGGLTEEESDDGFYELSIVEDPYMLVVDENPVTVTVADGNKDILTYDYYLGDGFETDEELAAIFGVAQGSTKDVTGTINTKSTGKATVKAANGSTLYMNPVLPAARTSGGYEIVVEDEDIIYPPIEDLGFFEVLIATEDEGMALDVTAEPIKLTAEIAVTPYDDEEYLDNLIVKYAFDEQSAATEKTPQTRSLDASESGDETLWTIEEVPYGSKLYIMPIVDSGMSYSVTGATLVESGSMKDYYVSNNAITEDDYEGISVEVTGTYNVKVRIDGENGAYQRVTGMSASTSDGSLEVSDGVKDAAKETVTFTVYGVREGEDLIVSPEMTEDTGSFKPVTTAKDNEISTVSVDGIIQTATPINSSNKNHTVVLEAVNATLSPVIVLDGEYSKIKSIKYATSFDDGFSIDTYDGDPDKISRSVGKSGNVVTIPQVEYGATLYLYAGEGQITDYPYYKVTSVKDVNGEVDLVKGLYQISTPVVAETTKENALATVTVSKTPYTVTSENKKVKITEADGTTEIKTAAALTDLSFRVITEEGQSVKTVRYSLGKESEDPKVITDITDSYDAETGLYTIDGECVTDKITIYVETDVTPEKVKEPVNIQDSDDDVQLSFTGELSRTKPDVEWEPVDDGVVVVSPTKNDRHVADVVTKGPGTTTVKVTYYTGEGESVEKHIREWTVNVRSLNENKGNDTLYVNSADAAYKPTTLTLIAEGATDEEDKAGVESWVTSNPDAVTVVPDENDVLKGVVTAKAAGTATITATIGGNPVTYDVEVLDHAVAESDWSIDNVVGLGMGQDELPITLALKGLEDDTYSYKITSYANETVASSALDGAVLKLSPKGVGTTTVSLEAMITESGETYTVSKKTVGITVVAASSVHAIAKITDNGEKLSPKQYTYDTKVDDEILEGFDYQFEVTANETYLLPSVMWRTSTKDNTGNYVSLKPKVTPSGKGTPDDPYQLVGTYTVPGTAITGDVDLLFAPRGLANYVKIADTAGNSKIEPQNDLYKRGELSDKDVFYTDATTARFTITPDDGYAIGKVTYPDTKTEVQGQNGVYTLTGLTSAKATTMTVTEVVSSDIEFDLGPNSAHVTVSDVTLDGEAVSLTDTMLLKDVAKGSVVTFKLTPSNISYTVDKPANCTLKDGVYTLDTSKVTMTAGKNYVVSVSVKHIVYYAAGAETKGIVVPAPETEISETIKQQTQLDKVVLNGEEKYSEIGKIKLAAKNEGTTTPVKLTGKVEWKSSAPEIVAVDAESGALSLGSAAVDHDKATITATYDGYDVPLELTVNVRVYGGNVYFAATEEAEEGINTYPTGTDATPDVYVHRTGNLQETDALKVVRDGESEAVSDVILGAAGAYSPTHYMLTTLNKEGSGTIKATASYNYVASTVYSNETKYNKTWSTDAYLTVSVESAEMKMEKDTLLLSKGLSASVKKISGPAKADMNWASSASSVATVAPEVMKPEDQSLTVNGVSSGIATLTGTIAGSKTESKITVKVYEITDAKNTVTWDETAKSFKGTALFAEGETSTMQLSVKGGGNATNSAKWASSKADVATVDENSGLVTLTGAGTTEISAVITEKVSEETTETVTLKLLLSVEDATLRFDGVSRGTDAAYIKKDTTGAKILSTMENVKYSSNNTAVATIDETTGVITPVEAGEVTFTAVSGDVTKISNPLYVVDPTAKAVLSSSTVVKGNNFTVGAQFPRNYYKATNIALMDDIAGISIVGFDAETGLLTLKVADDLTDEQAKAIKSLTFSVTFASDITGEKDLNTTATTPISVQTIPSDVTFKLVYSEWTWNAETKQPDVTLYLTGSDGNGYTFKATVTEILTSEDNMYGEFEATFAINSYKYDEVKRFNKEDGTTNVPTYKLKSWDWHYDSEGKPASATLTVYDVVTKKTVTKEVQAKAEATMTEVTYVVEAMVGLDTFSSTKTEKNGKISGEGDPIVDVNDLTSIPDAAKNKEYKAVQVNTPNLYDATDYAVVYFVGQNTNADPSSVKLDSAADAVYEIVAVDKSQITNGYGTIGLKLKDGQDPEAAKKNIKKVTFTLNCMNAAADAPTTQCTLSLKVNTKVPSFALSSTTGTIYGADATFGIREKNAKLVGDYEALYVATNKDTGDTGIDGVTVNVVDGMIIVAVDSSKITSNTNGFIRLHNTEWIDGAYSYAKFSIKIGKNPAIATTVATVNMMAGAEEAVEVGVFYAGGAVLPEDATIAWDASKLPSGVTIDSESSSVVTLTNDKAGKASGKLNVSVTVSGKTLKKTINVKVVDNGNVKFGLKGKIDAISGGNVFAQPKVTGYAGTIADVALDTGANSAAVNMFEAEYDAVSGYVKLSTTSDFTYAKEIIVPVVVTMSSGAEVKGTISVKPTFGKLSGSVEARPLGADGTSTPIMIANTYTYYTSPNTSEKRVDMLELSSDTITVEPKSSNTVTISWDGSADASALALTKGAKATSGKKYSGSAKATIKSTGKTVTLKVSGNVQ